MPENGDTMMIHIRLFLQGEVVSIGEFLSTVSRSDWQSFNIPLTNYTSADSATIILSTYYAYGPPRQFIPRGNSVLYVDNLSFDKFIVSVQDLAVQGNSFALFPNPASNSFTLEIGNSTVEELEVKIYDQKGALVKSQKFQNRQVSIGTAELSQGIYSVWIKSAESTIVRKLIVQR